MVFSGIIIVLAFAILLLAELINEVMEHGSDSLARMIDKFDRLLDKVTDKWFEK